MTLLQDRPMTTRRNEDIAARLGEELRPLLAARPTADNPLGIQELGLAVERRLAGLGFEVRRYPSSDAPDILVARRPGAGLRIGLAGHYDIEAAGDGWTRAPFEVSFEGGRMFGRGLADNLGPLLSRMQALASMGGETPDLVWVLQGEEEIGSPAAHRIYPTLGLPPVDLWLEETGYFELDGCQRLLLRRPSARTQTCVDAVLRVAHGHGRAVERHDRNMNKAFGDQQCPFLSHLVGEATYLAIGPNDPRSNIHQADESLPIGNLAVASDQFVAVLAAAALAR